MPGQEDIKLLFGVARDGDIGHGSDSEILLGLQAILQKINENPLKVIVSLDAESSRKKYWATQIQTQLDKLNESNKLTATISHVKIGVSGLNEFKSQISAMISTLNLDKNVAISITPSEEIGEIKKEFKAAGDEAEAAARKTARMKVQLDELSRVRSKLRSGRFGLPDVSNEEAKTQEDKTRISEIQSAIEQYNDWATEYNLISKRMKENPNLVSPEEIDALREKAAAIQEVVDKLLDQARAENAMPKEKDVARQIDATKKKLRDWSAAANGVTAGDYEGLKDYLKILEEIQRHIANPKENPVDFDVPKKYADAMEKIKGFSDNIIKAGKNTKALTERMGGLVDKFSTWLTVSQVVMMTYNAMRRMVSAVIDIDTAMTELKKVTNETNETYARFLDNAISRAKQLGATVADTVTATADFARLGYTIDEASELADAAIIYKNVGDGIENISMASESIISTMKAFKVEAKDAMLIVDKFNETGKVMPDGMVTCRKKTAISVKGRRRLRPRKDSLMIASKKIRRDCNISYGNIQGFAVPLSYAG